MQTHATRGAATRLECRGRARRCSPRDARDERRSPQGLVGAVALDGAALGVLATLGARFVRVNFPSSPVSCLREARAFVDSDSPRPRRRRTRTAVFPFLVLGMVARVARAEMAVIWRRFADSIVRLPMRAVCGVAAGAALLGSTPLRDPCAMPGRGNARYADTVTADRRVDGMQVQTKLRIEPRSASPASASKKTHTPAPADRPRSAGHRAERSLEEVIDANTMRYVDQAPRTSTQ